MFLTEETILISPVSWELCVCVYPRKWLRTSNPSCSLFWLQGKDIDYRGDLREFQVVYIIRFS